MLIVMKMAFMKTSSDEWIFHSGELDISSASGSCIDVIVRSVGLGLHNQKGAAHRTNDIAGELLLR